MGAGQAVETVVSSGQVCGWVGGQAVASPMPVNVSHACLDCCAAVRNSASFLRTTQIQ